jgi:lysophospholipase L1-like esterase
MVARCVAAVVLVLTACTPLAAPPRPVTYVAIGASDAVGIGARDPDTEGWVPRFGARLGDGTRVVNLGVSGSTLAQALDEQLGPAVDARPDVVTVWLAVNDFAARVPLERYVSDLDRLLTQLQPTGARVLVGNVPDLGRLPAFGGRDASRLRAEVDAWNQAIAATAGRHGAHVVDLHAGWQELAEHPEYVAQDGFHPSSEGYARLADLFAESLSSARP